MLSKQHAPVSTASSITSSTATSGELYVPLDERRRLLCRRYGLVMLLLVAVAAAADELVGTPQTSSSAQGLNKQGYCQDEARYQAEAGAAPISEREAEELAQLHALVEGYQADVTAGPLGNVTLVVLCVAASAKYDRMCKVARGNREDYVARHGYGLRFFSQQPAAAAGVRRSIVWHSVATTLSVLRSPMVEYAFKMDADSLLMDPTVSLDVLLPRGGYDVALSALALPPHRPGDPPRKLTRLVGNSGHLVWRATDWSRAMLEDIWRSYPPPISRACGDQPSYYVALTNHHPSCRASIIGPQCNASGDVAYDPRVRVLPNAVLNAWPPSRDALARICARDGDGVVPSGAGRLADPAAPSPPGVAPFAPSDFELLVPPRTMVLHFSTPSLHGGFDSDNIVDALEECAAFAAARQIPES